jgi:multidrug efflux pump subunit AcrB
VVGFFIQRPIFASAIAAILVLAGGVCFFLLPVSQFAEITPRRLSSPPVTLGQALRSSRTR